MRGFAYGVEHFCAYSASRVATFSMCRVCGKRSKGCSLSSLYPCEARYARSRACVSGPHET